MKRISWLGRRLILFPVQLFILALAFSAIFQVQIETTIRSEIIDQTMTMVMATPQSRMPAGGPSQLREDIQQGLEQSWGLDKPLGLRILQRSLDLLTLNLGPAQSARTRGSPARSDVSSLILEKLPASLLLYGLGGLASVLIGLALGLRAAWRHRGALDRFINLASPLFGSTPSWWIAMLLVTFFFFKWPILPFGDPANPANIIIPLIAIVGTRCWSFAFVARAAARSVLGEDWVSALRARGFSPGRIMRVHVLKASGGPFLTMGSIQVLQIMSTECVLENVILYPGLGSLLAKAAISHDISLACGILMCYGILYLVTMLLLDLAYGLIDPRVAAGRSR